MLVRLGSVHRFPGAKEREYSLLFLIQCLCCLLHFCPQAILTVCRMEMDCWVSFAIKKKRDYACNFQDGDQLLDFNALSVA